MKNFKDTLEEWATIYKPMQHTPGETGKNKRFFLFDNIVTIPSFMSKMPAVKSPCVGYEFTQEGTIKGGKIMPVHVVYFLVKCKTNVLTDKEQSYEAQREALIHMQKFLAWIKHEQDKREELRNINLDEEIRYSTYGPFLNNWYAIFIELSDVQKFNICNDENDYIVKDDRP